MSHIAALVLWLVLAGSACVAPGCATPADGELGREPRVAWRVAQQGHAWLGKELLWFPELLAEPRYSFGHCFTGREVLVFGGAFSSAFGWIRGGGFSLSLDPLAVTALPEAGAPDGRRDFATCWTGKEAIVWGGEAGTGASATEYRDASDGAAYDPRARRWRPLAPHPTPGVTYGGLCAWTGEEVVIAVERSEELELWAYHPVRDSWREIQGLESARVR